MIKLNINESISDQQKNILKALGIKINTKEPLQVKKLILKTVCAECSSSYKEYVELHTDSTGKQTTKIVKPFYDGETQQITIDDCRRCFTMDRLITLEKRELIKIIQKLL